jgi:hypothetical protein
MSSTNQLFLVSCLFILSADDHVNNVSYFPFMSIKKVVPYFCVLCEGYYVIIWRARQKNHMRFTGKCILYSLCQLSPQFSMFFLFKINNSLYISFQSFINTQILTSCKQCELFPLHVNQKSSSIFLCIV